MNTLFFDFEQLKQAYWNEPRPSLVARKDRILRLVTMLNENEENICKVIQADFGFRNIIETQLAELTTIRQAANLAGAGRAALPVSFRCQPRCFS